VRRRVRRPPSTAAAQVQALLPVLFSFLPDLTGRPFISGRLLNRETGGQGERESPHLPVSPSPFLLVLVIFSSLATAHAASWTRQRSGSRQPGADVQVARGGAGRILNPFAHLCRTAWAQPREYGAAAARISPRECGHCADPTPGTIWHGGATVVVPGTGAGACAVRAGANRGRADRYHRDAQWKLERQWRRQRVDSISDSVEVHDHRRRRRANGGLKRPGRIAARSPERVAPRGNCDADVAHRRRRSGVDYATTKNRGLLTLGLAPARRQQSHHEHADKLNPHTPPKERSPDKLRSGMRIFNLLFGSSSARLQQLERELGELREWDEFSQ